MKYFLYIVFALFVLSGSALHAQQPGMSAKGNQPAAPAVVLPPVIVPVYSTVTIAESTPANDNAEKNHSTNEKAVNPLAGSSEATPLAVTEIYRVGPGDVLDVRLLNFPSKQSSLFTVQGDGTLVYPYLSEPVMVNGLTAGEIAAQLNNLIKVFERPQSVVTIRHYFSHTVSITGLAAKPGPQALQREAVPLFVLLAIAQPLPEAQRVAITRPGQPVRVISLARQEELNFLLEAGDEINFLAAAPVKRVYFYIIGTVNAPGQKEFTEGMTLTQAIFASGGLTKGSDAKIRVLRQAADGRLTPLEYSLKRLSQGKDPDPTLQAGDRLEVFSKN